ncbi:PREDICTED: protein LSM12 homolog A-like [Amphimedon queenslandica]|uniref:AD domain-containing protein n=1 Tax=Amphimedon queenslandica TaxID=400682 RepID=A0A1X7VWD8_AMPQE|nr:PREDICTED: protein LSM12 homolog A-like [Amphimedon queenslandica]|eukprot:XP_019851088.1 PREDICTED: protein LSM12 homolog A-like [Amphimedon queenslandica]
MAASLKERDIGKIYAIGTAVSCEVEERVICRGYVIAFDNLTKSIIIQSSQTDKIHIINLSNVTVKSTSSSDKPKYIGKQKVDLNKIEQKYQEAIKKRKEELSRIGDGVSMEAQLLFDRIFSIYNQTVWDGSTIVVMKDVRISPPYGPENCTGSTDALERIQKLVTRFNNDRTSSKPAT